MLLITECHGQLVVPFVKACTKIDEQNKATAIMLQA
jgi:hypothetical protein